MADPIVITLPPDVDPAVLDRVLAALPDSAVAVREPSPPPAPEASPFADALEAAAAATRDLPGALARWTETMEQGETGLAGLALVVAGAMLAGYGVERLARLLAGRPVAGGPPPVFSRRLGGALWWLAGRAISLAVFFAVARLVVDVLLPAQEQPLALLVLQTVLRQRVIFSVIVALAAPGAPERRPVGLDEEGARRIERATLAVTVAAAILAILRDWLELFVGGAGVRLVEAALVVLTASVVVAWLFVIRRPIAGLIERTAADRPGAATMLLARSWHLFYAAIVGFSAVFATARALGVPGTEKTHGAIGNSLLVALFTPFVIAGVSAFLRERVDATPDRSHSLPIGLAALLKGGVAVGAATLVLEFWGLDPLSGRGGEAEGDIVPGLVRAAFTVVVGWSVWRAFDETMAVWAPAGRTRAGAAAPPDEDAGGAAGSRMDTIAPIMRGAALAVIVTFTVIFALSALGVNVTPLLAGAGVVGLAIGFGAQKLVADVINGAFYLYEDAFRIGEYIEADAGKGEVEGISLRSVRLRHPRGAIYTVPFSAMGTVQNHSRDWTKVKFGFDVPQATDLEKVRKLVKKVGEALMADPEIAPRIIEPLKSQGAIGIKGHAFEIGVKFTAKPGQQFLIRRKAMAALQKAFADNGIELMAQRVVFEGPAGAAAAPGPAAAGAG
jgi:small-conductance mechanosensitive channel